MRLRKAKSRLLKRVLLSLRFLFLRNRVQRCIRLLNRPLRLLSNRLHAVVVTDRYERVRKRVQVVKEDEGGQAVFEGAVLVHQCLHMQRHELIRPSCMGKVKREYT